MTEFLIINDSFFTFNSKKFYGFVPKIITNFKNINKFFFQKNMKFFF